MVFEALPQGGSPSFLPLRSVASCSPRDFCDRSLPPSGIPKSLFLDTHGLFAMAR